MNNLYGSMNKKWHQSLPVRAMATLLAVYAVSVVVFSLYWFYQRPYLPSIFFKKIVIGSFVCMMISSIFNGRIRRQLKAAGGDMADKTSLEKQKKFSLAITCVFIFLWTVLGVISGLYQLKGS